MSSITIHGRSSLMNLRLIKILLPFIKKANRWGESKAHGASALVHTQKWEMVVEPVVVLLHAAVGDATGSAGKPNVERSTIGRCCR